MRPRAKSWRAALIATGVVAAALFLLRDKSAPAPDEAAPAEILPVAEAAAPASVMRASSQPSSDDEPLLEKILRARRREREQALPAAPPARTRLAPLPERPHGFARMENQVASDKRYGAFIRTARELQLDPDKERRLTLLLLPKSAPQAPQTFLARAPAEDPPLQETPAAMRERAETLHELIGPIHEILGDDTNRFVGALLQPRPIVPGARVVSVGR